MKISERTSYPYPLLAPWSDDILPANITTHINFREAKETGQVTVHCEVTIDQPDILKLLNEGAAVFGCFIKCTETGFRRLQQFGFPKGTHSFAPGALLGRVQLRPMIWAAEAINSYSPVGKHLEFNGDVNIDVGNILVMDHEKVIDVMQAFVSSIESIFEIEASSSLEEGEFEIDTMSDRITIRVDEKAFELIQALRQTDDVSRVAVMNSLYVPTIMEVLSQLASGSEEFNHYRWVEPFLSRCEAVGVDLNNLDLMTDSQKLLGQPFLSLKLLVDDALTGSTK